MGANGQLLPPLKSNRIRIQQYLQDSPIGGGTRKEFFVQKEIDAQFGSFNISFEVDLIWVNNIEKPYYDKAYPTQNFSTSLTDNELDFKVNAELMQNSFRQGYYKSSDKFQNLSPFPYREDNLSKLQKTIVFQKDYAGNDVDIRYHVNTVQFNSRLNAELRRELEKEGDDLWLHHMSDVFKYDYMTYGRQYAVYLIECSKVDCKHDMFQQVVDDLNAKYSDKIVIKMINEHDKTQVEEKLISNIKSLINREFELESLPQASQLADIEDDGIKMFQKSVSGFLLFLRTEYFPRIASFKKESNIYQFESPLNFLMLRSDLKDFLEAFYQAESLLQYALKFQIDSLFTIRTFNDKTDHFKKKQEASYMMLKEHQIFMSRCLDILKEYDHLVPHDSSEMDCIKSNSMGCKFRVYGASIISIASLSLLMIMYFKTKFESLTQTATKKLI